jgi:hypothetical protein
MYGKITKKVPEGTEGAIKRTNKKEDVVYEVHYDYVKGLLLDIGVSDHKDYGKQWLFTLRDGVEMYQLRIGENTPALTSLLKVLPNCCLKQPITIEPYDFTGKDGKKRSGVTLKQEGKKVERFFTREDPKGLPDIRPIATADGKETWDSSEQMQFLKKYVDEHITPQLAGTSALLNTLQEDGQEQENALNPDDMPF